MEKQTEDNVVLVHNPFNALLEVEKDTSKGREVQGEAIAIVTDDTSGRERNDNEVCQGPWVVLGDFNAISSIEDRLGSLVRLAEIGPMLECMNDCELVDIKASGRYYTWTNKQEGDVRVFSRIDRVLVHSYWMESFELAEATFLPKGNFYHTLILLCVYPDIQRKKPFRFCNAWCSYPELLEVVK
ncbi:uncharacterized protein LOC130590009 [Beta vulgaris subsp. vulgaris]|uniref:uncharacterized protein LOC130590009 n=1 Tax=Beta vulgaris subsp. vulgaris TaxID=3555 RepID=UPI000900DDC2|nr:uncharacterized protein LOC130590009 [Beta vulgaris subsp. vulgaris]